MVKTRAELKIKIKEWVDNKQAPFKSTEVEEYASTIAPNIMLNTNRIAQYIRAGNNADYKKPKWIPKTKVRIDTNGICNKRKIQRIHETVHE